jgi:hypothetical protein
MIKCKCGNGKFFNISIPQQPPTLFLDVNSPPPQEFFFHCLICNVVFTEYDLDREEVKRVANITKKILGQYASEELSLENKDYLLAALEIEEYLGNITKDDLQKMW